MYTRVFGCFMAFYLTLVWLSGMALAATPEHIFAQASASVVVVEVIDTQGEIAAQGSGVITSPGLIVTPCHVAQAGQSIRILHAHTSFTGTLGYADVQRDLCQVHAARLPAPPVAHGSVKTLAVGQPVYVVSAPQGLGLTFTAGIISALRPVMGSYVIQTDAAVSPGSSGGGLFDRSGRLIGMASFQLQEGQQLNFALPVDWIMDVARQCDRKAGLAPSSGTQASEWEQRAAVLRAKRDWPGLIKLGHQWLRHEPENIIALGTLGEAYSHVGQHDKALVARRKVVYHQPEDAEAWHNLGATYSELQRHSAARIAFQKAFQLRGMPQPETLAVRFDALQPVWR